MSVRLIIAMVLVASVAQAQPSQGGGDAGPVSQITVTGARKGEKLPPPAVTIDMQTDDSAIGQFVSVYPDGAFQAKVSGQVTLNCDVDIYGLAEWCEVLSETPEGKNFGRAAMTLRPTFKVPPAMGPKGPVRSMMRIAMSMSLALRSGILASAISRIWLWVTLPATTLPGSFEPPESLAAFLRK